MNIFIWLSHKKIAQLIEYNLAFTVGLFLAFAIVTKVSQATRTTFIVSTGFSFLLFVILLLSGKNLNNSMVLVVGICSGAIIGAYYSGYNMLTTFLTTKSNCSWFVALGESLGNLLSIVVPVLTGWMLSTLGFPTVFTVMVVITLLQFALIVKLPNFTRIPFAPRARRKNKWSKKHFVIFTVLLSFGYLNTLYQFGSGWIWYQFNSNISTVGFFNTLLSLLLVVGYLSTKKIQIWISENLQIAIGMTGILIGFFLFAGMQKWSLAIGLSIISISIPLFWVPIQGQQFTWIKKWSSQHEEECSYRNIGNWLIWREFSMALGRILLFLIFILSPSLIHKVAFNLVSVIALLFVLVLTFGIMISRSLSENGT